MKSYFLFKVNDLINHFNIDSRISNYIHIFALDYSIETPQC